MSKTRRYLIVVAGVIIYSALAAFNFWYLHGKMPLSIIVVLNIPICFAIMGTAMAIAFPPGHHQ